MKVKVVVGIDPSVRATGIAVVPVDWGGDWSKVFTAVVKGDSAKEVRERIRRNTRIAEETRLAMEEGADAFRHLAIFIEDYAHRRALGAHRLGELGGAIRYELLRYNEVVEVVASKARKLLLGKVPVKGKKLAVYSAIRASGGSKMTLDEADAFCIANYGLSELGAYCLIGAP